MKRVLSRVVLGLAGLAVGVVSVLALREATLSTHDRVERHSTTVVEMRARTHGTETNQTAAEAVEALVQVCRLEVASDLVRPVRARGEGQFRALLAPALDQTNRRQFRGCIEDWTVDHLMVDVLDMRSSD